MHVFGFWEGAGVSGENLHRNRVSFSPIIYNVHFIRPTLLVK